MLYQVATATLAPSDITAPIRRLLRRQRNTTVLLAEAREIDVERRVVHLQDAPHEVSYDYLVVASGARHSYFGHDEWEALAPGLKSIEDALEIRRRFLLAFERAEQTDDEVERAAYQTIVVVGGGPTGVELAGMIPSIAHRALRKDFRRIDTRRTRVILLEAGPRLLPTLPETLSRRAKRDLEELGVEVRTNAAVTAVELDGVSVGDERITAKTVMWAAGNAASPLARSLGVPLDKAGRAKVRPDLSLPERPEVFVVGDLAAVEGEEGLVPAVAPAAMQEGETAARNIIRDLLGQPRQAFRYHNKGELATIGRHRAVADFGRVRLTGAIAWWFWLFLHIMYLAGFRNRLSVLLEWGYSYITYEQGVRLITAPPRGVALPASGGAERPVAPRR